MGVEGMARGLADGSTLLVGLAIFTAAKALKLWAIASLGVRWSFKVLVLPDAPLVTTGPYRLLRHPNYVAVTGELVGVAIAVGAPIAGAIGTLVFVWLMRRRVEIEERALGIRK